MTTLPTPITHKPGQTEPLLHFPEPAPFNKAIKKIRTKQKSRNGKKKELPEDLAGTLKAIEDGKLNEIQETHRGASKIHDFLRHTNDIVRICRLPAFQIETPIREYHRLGQLPRIEVEFVSLKNHRFSSPARLSLIDTPGPNEGERAPN